MSRGSKEELVHKEKPPTEKLRRIAEYRFLEGLTSDVTPYVMGCLPDDVQAEMDVCLNAGIPKNVVESTVNKAWRTAYRRYRTRRR